MSGYTYAIRRYGATTNRPHSSGAVYLAFNNLHRSVRFLPHNIHLVTMIPGPKEPSLEQINYVLEPVKDELDLLYIGESNRSVPCISSAVHFFE